MYVSFQSDLKGVSSLGVQYKQKHKAGSSERNKDTQVGQEVKDAEGELGSNCGRRTLTL